MDSGVLVRVLYHSTLKRWMDGPAVQGPPLGYDTTRTQQDQKWPLHKSACALTVANQRPMASKSTVAFALQLQEDGMHADCRARVARVNTVVPKSAKKKKPTTTTTAFFHRRLCWYFSLLVRAVLVPATASYSYLGTVGGSSHLWQWHYGSIGRATTMDPTVCARGKSK